MRRSARLYIASFLVPFLMLLGVMILFGVTPFGDRTFLYDDTNRQYINYYNYYKSVFAGPNDFTYTMDASLGTPIFGFAAYYLTSPLLLFLLLVPSLALPAAISILILVKTSLIGLSMYHFLRCRYRESPVVLVFSTSFAFCGWIISYMINLMWLDPLVVMPLLYLEAERILEGEEKHRVLPFVLTAVFTALMLYLNYYIAYICLLFLALLAAVNLLLPAGRKAGTAGNFRTRLKRFWIWVLAEIMGAALSAWITLPTFLSLFNGVREPFESEVGAERVLTPVKALSRIFSLVFDTESLYFGTPALCIGIPCTMAVILFFFNREIPVRRRVFAGTVVILMTASFCVPALDLIWHAGVHPSGYPYRESVLLSFVMVTAACECILKRKGLKERDAVISAALLLGFLVLVKRQNFTCLQGFKIFYNAALIAASLVLFVLLIHAGKKDAKEKNRSAGRGGGNTAANPAASETCGAGAGAEQKPAAVKIRNTNRILSAAAAALVLLQAADLLVNEGYTYAYGSMLQVKASEYRSDSERIGGIVKEIKSADSGFYRIESTAPRTENDAMQFDYHGVNSYSSIEQNVLGNFLLNMGNNDNRLYPEYDPGNTAAQDMILGIRYLYDQDGYHESFAALPVFYMTGASVKATQANTESILSSDSEASAGRAFNGNPFKYQSAILSSLTGTDEEVFTEAKLECADDGETYTITPQSDGELYFYLQGILDDTQDITLTFPGGETKEYGNASCKEVQDLGEGRKGESVTLRVHSNTDEPVRGTVLVVTENRNTLKKIADSLSGNACAVTEVKSSEFELSVPDIKESGTLVLALPYDTAWQITVDGERVEPKALFGVYMGLDISEGTHEVHMKYVTPGLAAGCWISCISVILLSAAVLLRRKNYHGNNRSLFQFSDLL